MKSIRLLLVAAALSASGAKAAVEVYDVDPAYRQEVLDILRLMLSIQNGELQGRVELLPTGQIVVDTNTDRRQAEIAALLGKIASSEPEETPTASLRYWVLHGVPGAADAPNLPAALADVVRELESVHGDLGVEVLDAASVTSRSGSSGGFDNDRWEIRQRVNVNGDRLNGSIVVDHELQELSVELSLRRGDFVVLAAGTSQQVAEGGVLALIVNWPKD